MRVRVIAAATALWLVLCGILASHHEASVAHLRDAAGAYVHGKALAGHHDGHSSDIHGQRHPDADAGECALLTTYHQPASADVTAPAVLVTACTTHERHVVPVTILAIAAAVYRLAPKTSPPAAA
ncbi:MAG TPA: hypothetical protein VHW23_21845 [Kofleriaceae bacterium]|jgi:hypothetical protein|nr:hypothetical protein [Kofleriaceae bacterium]